MMMHQKTKIAFRRTSLLKTRQPNSLAKKCLATVQFIRSIIDSTTARAARIFECGDCGQRTWDD